MIFLYIFLLFGRVIRVVGDPAVFATPRNQNFAVSQAPQSQNSMESFSTIMSANLPKDFKIFAWRLSESGVESISQRSHATVPLKFNLLLWAGLPLVGS